MDDPAQWTVHGSRRVYTSDWVDVDLDEVEIPGRARFEHHVLRFPRPSAGAVVVDGDRVLLLWRHRFIVDTWGWEIPAGWVDAGEEPVVAAAREVAEETGYRAGSLAHLVTVNPMPGISTHRFHLYVATDLTRVGEPDPAESSRREWVATADLPALIGGGDIADAATVSALGTYLVTRG